MIKVDLKCHVEAQDDVNLSLRMMTRWRKEGLSDSSREVYWTGSNLKV